jgi:hypothetical protein
MITSITILAVIVGVLFATVVKLSSTTSRLSDQVANLKSELDFMDEVTDARFENYHESITEMKKDIENLMDDVADQGIK